MNSCLYSPLRDKRRQSDAKWRASVATCYDALKYVIPNVKSLSKKKISKALILQECEKHIQGLEDTISFLLHIECKNQGQVGLWKEGHYWTHCSMESLHNDFSEKQRRVFTSSARGRRCYHLLRDIKEDVFNMTADSKQMAFFKDDSIELLRVSENQRRGSYEFSPVSVIQFPAENLRSIALCEENVATQTTVNISKSVCIREEFPINKRRDKCLEHVQNGGSSNVDIIQMRKLYPHKEPICLADSTILSRLSDCERNSSSDALVPSGESLYLPPEMSSANSEKSQIVYCMGSPATSSSVQEVSSSTHISLAVSDTSGEISSTVHSWDSVESHKLKPENLDDSLYILSNEKEYACLLRALETEKEQEVPSLENGLKTTRIKRPRLINSGSDTVCTNSYSLTCGSSSKENNCFRHDVIKENVNAAQNSTDCLSHTSRSKISTLTSRSGFFSSLKCLNVPDIKIETDKSTLCNSHDPMLSSLNMPKFDLEAPMFCLAGNDSLLKQPKYKSARKMLNVNCPALSGWTHISGHLLSPHKARERYSMHTGFTPVKLPDDLAFNSDQDNPLESLTSPWKTLNSPFNIRIVPQGHIDNSSVVDLDDNSLLCLETIDAVDFANGLDTEVTPVLANQSEKSQQPELQKSKRFSFLPKPDNRVMPKCRRRLERFYDLNAQPTDHVNMTNENHVVPQLDLTTWTSTYPHCQRKPHSIATFDIEESLVCLETFDTT